MTIEIFKKICFRCCADLQYVGLLAAGIHVKRITMMYGGKHIWPLVNNLYTGKSVLLVNCGGLTNKVLQSGVKKLFKHDVLPIMTEHFPEISSEYTGRIELHFRESRLTTFILTH